MRKLMAMMALAAALAGGSCTASINVEQERTALLERDRAWSAAAKVPDQFVSYFATDASIYAPGMPVVTGTEQIRKSWQEMTAVPGFSIRWTPARAVVSTAGDLGYTTGMYEITTQGGTEKGKYVTTWKKDAGQWKVVEDIFNPDGPTPASHAMVASDTLTWTDAPPGLPPGAKFAVVSGDPSQAQPFVLRAQFPAGYSIGPHWHPAAENVTVLAGTVALGMGDTFDQTTMKDLAVGGYAVMPAEMRHSFLAKTASTIQVHGTGPFAITYVNPADDPRQKKQ